MHGDRYLWLRRLGAVDSFAVSQLVLPGRMQLLEVRHRAVAHTGPALHLKSPAALLIVPPLLELTPRRLAPLQRIAAPHLS